MSVVDEVPHLTDSSDDEFVIGASAQVPKKRRRRAPLGAAGSLACFFLLCNGALVAESDELHRLWATTVDTEPHFGADSSGVLGLVFCTWKFLQDDDDDEIGRSLQRQQVRSRKRATIHGYLRYVAQHVFLFDDGIQHSVPEFLDQPRIYAPIWCHQFSNLTLSSSSIETLCSHYGCKLPVSGFVLSSFHCEILVQGSSNVVQDIALTSRLAKSSFQPLFPPFTTIRKYVRETLARAASEAENDCHGLRSAALYELPGKKAFVRTRRFGKAVIHKDPVNVFKYLRFARRLQDASVAPEVLEAALDFAVPDDELFDEVQRQKPTEPGKNETYTARLKLDATSMLLEQREFRHIYQTCPDSIVSAHLYSDASPVTGTEIQGMALDVCYDDWQIQTMVMPGVALHFGGAKLIHKVVAFLWSLSLMLGPQIEIMRWFLNKIGSVTSDMGTEFGFIDIGNILAAFIRWRAGEPLARISSTAVESTKLLPNALRVPGWGHLFGNLMKFLVKSVQGWLEILNYLRQLVKFFNYGPWREELVRALRFVYPEGRRVLKSFHAQLTKWRYETIHGVFAELLRIREVCETHVAAALQQFTNFKDVQLLNDVRRICAWKEIWAFLSAFFPLLETLEGARRWGLVCPCCAELRAERPRVRLKCPWNSRRLGEARVFMKSIMDQLKDIGRSLTRDMCDGVDWVFSQTKAAALVIVAEIRLKFKWLWYVPWRITETLADPRQAEICRLQLLSANPDLLGPLERRQKDELLDELSVLIYGGLNCTTWHICVELSTPVPVKRKHLSPSKVQTSHSSWKRCGVRFWLLHRGGCSHGVQSGVAQVLLLHATTPWGLLSRCAIWGCSSIALLLGYMLLPPSSHACVMMCMIQYAFRFGAPAIRWFRIVSAMETETVYFREYRVVWRALYDAWWAHISALASIADDPLHPDWIRLHAETRALVEVLHELCERIRVQDPEFYDEIMAVLFTDTDEIEVEEEQPLSDGENTIDPTDDGH